jgi:SAM-dependent methyltransferase
MMNRHNDTLERLIPDEAVKGATGEETLQLHLERYEFSARHARGKRVLDIACGTGYGTSLLAERCGAVESFVGVDQSEEAIAYARERYGNERINFISGNAMTFDDKDGFDTIISLETIEHLPNPIAFIGHLVTLLRPGAVLVASVPTTPSVDANPHHLHDFSEKSFRRLFLRHRLKELDLLLQVQPFNPGTVLTRSEKRLRDMRHNLPSYYLSHPGSLVRRIWSTLRYGFTNRYTTIVWQAPPLIL